MKEFQALERPGPHLKLDTRRFESKCRQEAGQESGVHWLLAGSAELVSGSVLLLAIFIQEDQSIVVLGGAGPDSGRPLPSFQRPPARVPAVVSDPVHNGVAKGRCRPRAPGAVCAGSPPVHMLQSWEVG